MLRPPVCVSGEVEVLANGTSLLTFSSFDPSDISLRVTIFADSAPALRQEFKLSEIDPDRSFAGVIEQEVKRIRTSNREGPARFFGSWS